MKRLLVACCLFFAAIAAHAATPDPALVKQINAFVNGWHDDASHARWSFFDKIAPDGVVIGTDKTELWNRDAFKAAVKKSFDSNKGWVSHLIHRNVYTAGDVSWFDELIDTPLGMCQASGVVRKTAKGFEIVHYQLSMAVPNAVNKQVAQLIKDDEARHQAK